MVAVDLNSNRELVLQEGRVVDAIMGSIAIPGLSTPLIPISEDILVMPLIGGVIGVLVGHLMLGFGVGGTTLVLRNL